MVALSLFAPRAEAQTALVFDGSDDRVTFGTAAALGTPTFTIEVWFKRTGTGVVTSTGTGGVTNAIPLLTKGRGEQDGDNRDMNYFLGIRADSVLCADYEEGDNQLSEGLNHPVVGTTKIVNNVWYHAAATYNGTSLRLYLNGNLESSVDTLSGRLPQSGSIQHAGLGTAMTSTGAAAGFFAGILDEARVWNHARPQAGIADSMDLEIASAPGLLGRWGLNEGTGSTAGNSVGGSPNGSLNAPVWTFDSPFRTEWSLDFGGTDAYVALGDPGAFDLGQFTIECWFRRDGAGDTTSTGSGGVTNAVPLVTKGRGEVDGTNVDVNWFLGIRASDGVLVADFEEGPGGSDPGQNHPVIGFTPVTSGVWHHAAATYDGTTWRLYLDGSLDGLETVGEPPASNSIQPAAIGSALRSNNEAEGFFDGLIDEVRIWSVARSGAQIAADVNSEPPGPVTDLVARYGLDEGSGSSVSSSAGAALPGTITGVAWSWSAGAPFNLVVPPATPPAAPSGLDAAAITNTLVRLTWTDGSNNETGFEIERSTTGIGGPYTPRATVAANVTTWDDTGLSSLTEYCYRVRAVNFHGTSSYATADCATTPETPRAALDFGGSDAYVTFGDPAALDLAQFTIECWFRRDAQGNTTTTGTDGVGEAIPLVVKGRGEDEQSNIDLNWFLGIDDSSDVLCADFEEGAGGSDPSQNHPVRGVTPIGIGVWHHAAATYDGSTWRLYLDGNLETALPVNQPVASASTQPASLGSGLRSTNVAEGFFDGVLDECRVWNYARSQTEIRGTANAELSSAVTGLVARWALDEGTGTAVGGSAGTSIGGSITGSDWAWTLPAPFNLAFNDPPGLPVLEEPSDGATGVPLTAHLEVTATDPDTDPLTVTFYGRPSAAVAGPDFTLIGLPDTQYYTSQINGGSNAILKSQMQWLLDNRLARNIVYTVQLGDCVENGDNGGNPIEWMRADSAYVMIEDPIATTLEDGMPYGICVGNHDQSPAGSATGTTNFYNQYFGEARFLGREYYGGHYGANNDNWVEYFSASGMDFIVIGFEYDTAPDVPVLDWADALLKSHPNHRAIVCSHSIIGSGNPGTFSSQGQATYDALKDNPNLFLMLCGHVSTEGRRTDVFSGSTVHTVLSDYQSRPGGGNGWLRIYEFSPANDVIRVRTYSPWLQQFEADTDSSSQFTLAYEMSSAAAFQQIGSVQIASGGTASIDWAGLQSLTGYEWYATVNDGHVTRTGPVWDFTTGAGNPPPSVTVVEPNGGETLPAASWRTIKWTASDDIGVTSVDLLVSRTGPGGPFDPIATGIANTGTYVWTPGEPQSADAWFKVVAYDGNSNVTSDMSDAAFTISAPVGVDGAGVIELALSPMVPNPIQRMGTVQLAIPHAMPVRASIIDLQGREVAVLADRAFTPGRHELIWNGRTAAGAAGSGMYFVSVRTPDRHLVRRFLVVR